MPALRLSWIRDVPAFVFLAPLRPSAARAAHRELRALLRLFRASKICAIGARPLFVPFDMASYTKAYACK